MADLENRNWTSHNPQEHDIADAPNPAYQELPRQDREATDFDFSGFDLPSLTELEYAQHNNRDVGGSSYNSQRGGDSAETIRQVPVGGAGLSFYKPPTQNESQNQSPAESPDLERPRSLQRVPVGSRRPSASQLSTSSQLTPAISSETQRPLLASTRDIGSFVDEHGGASLEIGGDSPRQGENVPKGNNVRSPEIQITEWPDESSTAYPMNYSTNFNDNDKDPLLNARCESKENLHQSRGGWLSISIIILSIYSTIFSGIWLFVGMIKPRYGQLIQSRGSHLSPSSASILFALFAKTVELSFVTVFVAFLGQVLSRRAVSTDSRGVTITEMSMRTWVIQPGFMITHFENMKHVSRTLLGVISLTAALVAMLYTTASDALVSPHLKFGDPRDIKMYGAVNTSYANITFVKENCGSPVPLADDPINRADTCLAVEYSGEAYHNYLNFLANWTEINGNGTKPGTSQNLADRPQASGMLFDNTTITGQWVATDTSDMQANFAKYSRIINNVTMSFPHANVIPAAQSRQNKILQPAELNGLGEYKIQAAVVSPSINVLCADMMESELAPLVYINWPNAETDTDTDVPRQTIARSPDYIAQMNETRFAKLFLNSTPVDDIFEWGEKYKRPPAAFPQFPIDFNTLTDVTAPHSDSIYLLLKSPLTTNYTLCQLRSFLNPNCSTWYNVSGTTDAHISAHCEDPSDHMSYRRYSEPKPPTNRNEQARDFLSGWSTSLSLNTGITNSNASISRQLTQFIPTTPKLNATLPSIAEALATFSGCTLLLGSKSATYKHYWGFDSTHAPSAKNSSEEFMASVSSQEFTSGPQLAWQNSFYVVLALVFATNCFCLGFLLYKGGYVTDFTEPQNLFAIAVNSPPSRWLRGACGAGPHGEQLRKGWKVGCENTGGQHGHFYIASADEVPPIAIDDDDEDDDGFEKGAEGGRRRNWRRFLGGRKGLGIYEQGGEGENGDYELRMRKRSQVSSLGGGGGWGRESAVSNESFARLSRQRAGSWL